VLLQIVAPPVIGEGLAVGDALVVGVGGAGVRVGVMLGATGVRVAVALAVRVNELGTVVGAGVNVSTGGAVTSRRPFDSAPRARRRRP
jgi:hypothetical protein